MMKSVLKPGSIVSVDYSSFDGKPLHGFFCVLYDEELDSANGHMNNFTAIKVTTSFNMLSNYAVPVTDGNTTIFNKDCMALCSKIHTFSKDQVTEVKGRLHPITFRNVYRCYRRFITELERQMEVYF